ncbi:hypothetical protein BSKO_08756 [Bryopsis sp. KO-2023]|nr:hypothetical protein BSKO_08756 [Bryopsis sp. KO-2023]
MVATPHSPTTPADLSDGVLASALHEEGPDVSLNLDNFWGLAVGFRNAEVERRYQAEALRVKLRQDVQVHFHGLFPGLYLAYRYWGSVSWVGLATMMSLSLITAPLCLYICLRKASLYRRLRTAIIVFINLHAISMFQFLAHEEEDSETPSACSLLASIVQKSPITVGLFFSLNGNLPLHHNLMLQVLNTPLFLLWSFNFCKMLCSCGTLMMRVLEELAIIVNMLMVVLSNAVVGEDRISCVLIVGSVVLFLGVLVPTALAYNLDIARRKAFVLRNYSSEVSIDFEQSISDTQAAIWYLVAVIQSVWVIFIVLSDM